MARFKLRCWRCRKNYVLVSARQRFAQCYDCQKSEMVGKIDKKFGKMFDISEEFYKENSFLRDIKIKAIKFGELSEKQVAAFKKVVKEMKAELKEKK
jgi:hypothetical protein